MLEEKSEKITQSVFYFDIHEWASRKFKVPPLIGHPLQQSRSLVKNILQMSPRKPSAKPSRKRSKVQLRQPIFPQKVSKVIKYLDGVKFHHELAGSWSIQMNPASQNPAQEPSASRDNRSQFILDYLDKHDGCTYEELAQLLGVSAMTIRRDLERLQQKGAVIKTVGGAQLAQAHSYMLETALLSRLRMQRTEKRAIANRALELIEAESTIFIDGSTTCLEFARCIAKEKKNLTIVTNSALACVELGKGGNNTIVGIGGQYDGNSLCYVGPQAEDLAKELFLDMAFVGTKALLPADGTFESSVPTMRIKQIVAARCAHLTLLADHSKFGQRALSKVLDIAQINTVVTDDQVREEDLATLAKSGPKVLVAARQSAPSGRASDVA